MIIPDRLGKIQGAALERVLKAVAEQPVAAAGNYFASLRSGSKAGTVDMFLDLSTGWL